MYFIQEQAKRQHDWSRQNKNADIKFRTHKTFPE